MDANERRERASAEAAHWWALIGNRPPNQVSEADRRDFTVWLRESPLHIAEILRIADIDDTLRHFKLWHELPGATPEDSGDNIVRFRPPSAGMVTESAIKTERRRSGFALAAAVAAVAILAAWLAWHSSDTVLSTDRAERREVMLADGSVVSLGPETQMRVRLTKTERRITLEHGRALFRVAKDPGKPFFVLSEGTQVRAVGTIFGVEDADQNIIVTVKEGKVAVTKAPATSNSQLEQSGATTSGRSQSFLTSNEQMTVSAAGAPGPVQQVDAGRALAWSEGVLVFNSTPLDEVARRFNQYNRVQIRIRDAELGHRTVSGIFRAADPQTLIDFIRAGARVTVTRNSADEIVVSSVAPANVTPDP
jgi:transmembrane sensor